MGRRSKTNFSFNDLIGQAPVVPEHVCDKEGCGKPAEYRAPKDRTLTDYYWFCLEHVQEYNARWDYYEGMSPLEIEEHLKQDVCWQRPTWKLGERGVDPSMFSDPLGIKKEAFGKAEGLLAERSLLGVDLGDVGDPLDRVGEIVELGGNLLAPEETVP